MKLKHITLILVSSFIIRFLFPFFLLMLQPEFKFHNTIIPYYLDADSYYYAHILEGIGLPKLVVYLVPLVFTFACLVLVYLTLINYSLSVNKAFLSTMSLSIFPYFFNQTALGIIDTPSFIVCIICLNFYCLSNIINKNKIICNIAIILISQAILTLIWSGRPLISLMFVASALIALCNKYWHYLAYGLFGLAAFIIFYSRLAGLLLLKQLGVSEYKTPTFILYHILALFVLYLFFAKPRDYKDKLTFFLFLFNFGISLFIARFTIFAVVFMFVFMAIKVEDIKIYALICFLSLIFLFFAYVNYEPIVNADVEDALSKADNSPIISLWDNGHIIRYFGKEPVFWAYPDEISLNKIIHSYASEYPASYLDEFGYKEYYVFINKYDYAKAYYLANRFGILFYRTNFSSSGFDTIQESMLYKRIV